MGGLGKGSSSTPSQLKKYKSKRGSLTKATTETGLTESYEIEPPKMFTGSFQVKSCKGPLVSELEAANPTTDKFLLETYEKLKQLEEDIQKRKAKEAILMSQRTRELQNIETRTT